MFTNHTHDLISMPKVYIPPELKSWIVKTAVFDYLWHALHSDAPDSQLRTGEHMAALLQSCQELRAITLEHLSKALSIEIDYAHGVPRLKYRPWSKIAFFRQLTTWKGSIAGFYSLTLLLPIDNVPFSPVPLIYTYQSAALELAFWQEPPDSKLTTTEVGEHQASTSGALLSIGLECFTEVCSKLEWYREIIPGLQLSLKVHLLWAFHVLLHYCTTATSMFESRKEEMLAHQEPPSVLSEQEKLIDVCVSVLQKAVDLLNRVAPLDDWDLIDRWNLAARIPHTLKAVMALEWSSELIDSSKDKARQLLDSTHHAVVRFFPRTHEHFIAALQ